MYTHFRPAEIKRQVVETVRRFLIRAVEFKKRNSSFLKTWKKKFFRRKSILEITVDEHDDESNTCITSYPGPRYVTELTSTVEEFHAAIQNTALNSMPFSFHFQLPPVREPDFFMDEEVLEEFNALMEMEKICSKTGEKCRNFHKSRFLSFPLLLVHHPTNKRETFDEMKEDLKSYKRAKTISK